MAAQKFANGNHGFIQQGPVLRNQYSDDKILAGIMQRYVAEDRELLSTMEADLTKLGDKVVTEEMLDMLARAEVEIPRLEQFDAFGKRIDKLILSEGWSYMKPIAAKEGIVATAYERDSWKHYARLFQFAKMYIYSPSSALFTCPLAMTDGGARLLELYREGATPSQVEAYKRLTSRDPNLFWTSGQWMTERGGGSDVGMTETQAVPQADGSWKVYGFKWFSSATDSQATLLLARAWNSKEGDMGEGSGGLSLFFAEMRDRETGKLNGIRIQRLKNKVGTKPLPTAELELDGMKAELIGKPNRGTATVATILNVTRIWTAVSACSYLRRGLAIARDYADKRVAFGAPISQHPMHLLALAKIDLNLRAINQVTFYVANLLGKSEYTWYKKQPEDKAEALLLRLLTPVVKVFSSHIAVDLLSEAMEALGGQGYIEDVGIARLWRDAEVLKIWEGTTNTLAHDLLRVLRGQPKAFAVFAQAMEGMISAPLPDGMDSAAVQVFESTRAVIVKALAQLGGFIESMGTAKNRRLVERRGRDLIFSFGRIAAASLLHAQARFSMSAMPASAEARADLAALRRWCAGKEEWGGQLVANGLGAVPMEGPVEDDDSLLAMGRFSKMAKL